MRPTKDRIFVWICSRMVLQQLASVATNLDSTRQFYEVRDALIAELQALKPGDDLPEIWQQACAAMLGERRDGTDRGLAAYALQRIGLLKEPEPEK